eukprot:3439730-Prymnesium_polylepis.1
MTHLASAYLQQSLPSVFAAIECANEGRRGIGSEVFVNYRSSLQLYAGPWAVEHVRLRVCGL